MIRFTDRLFIPIELLEKFSEDNYKKLNRSVDVKVLKKHYPDCFGVLCSNQFSHNHAFGEEVEPHFRYMIDGLMTKSGVEEDSYFMIELIQDFTAEQHQIIHDFKTELLKHLEEEEEEPLGI